ncbi:Protein MEI2-like 2 [Acorus calamus]|uniref:Protein MEI2-like 2 n=1 Tax=Acorus calamus TaxID=4465 RepID=A0AAV9FHR0_ACOCL|nr:Protein MEI2-like 2 [Acorus calamus]
MRGFAMGQSSDHSVSAELSKVASAEIPPNTGTGLWGFPEGSSDVNLSGAGHGMCSTDEVSSKLSNLCKDIEDKDQIEDMEAHAIGSLLPGDEDELLAGIMDDFDLSELPNEVEELEEYDLFGSGGGMEMDQDPTESLSYSMANASLSDRYMANGNGQFGLPNGVSTIAGEHPHGEHPSRTLFVRNINSNVEDSELRSLFEQYGDIRTLYTACKHRGFVMISYYDIRHARSAMRALQSKPLRRRKLDIHFSIPKDNPSDKDVNQGTLVVFNLDPSVSNEELLLRFGAYGEVKEIRETPHKKHHKFVEYYDVRSAEAALRALNRSDIAGKRIKLEPSRPGGARRNMMQQLTQELDQDESRGHRPLVGSPITNSPPGSWAMFNSTNDNSSLQALSQSPVFGAISPMTGNHLPGLASIISPLESNSIKITPIGKDQNRVNNADRVSSNTIPTQRVAFHHSQSFPERSSGIMPNMSPTSGSVSSFGPSATMNGPQFLWGSPAPHLEHSHSPAWSKSSMVHSFSSSGQGRGFPYTNRHGSFLDASRQNHHHVGSAPSGIAFERHFGFVPESPEASFVSPVSFGGMGFSRNEGSHMINVGGRAPMTSGLPLSGNISENGSPGFGMMSSQILSPMFLGSYQYPGNGSSGIDVLTERGWSRRVENNGNQIDIKKQFQLDLEKIVSGEDARTTLMIKNIPNKYTSKMLLAAIDEHHRGTYDFLYLPIDFKNKCNVGYAFINMVSPLYIVPFYQAFNGKKWEKFNSEKVASLAYARIQGKDALVTHFQNSSLMNEDKRCRPILFNFEGPEAGDQIFQEAFPPLSVNSSARPQDGTSLQSVIKNNLEC